jgi:hypothetical protein
MSKTIQFGAVCLVAVSLAVACVGQEPPQPGPEHRKLKELEGTWDAVMKMGSEESKAVATYKMDLGGLWLVSDFQGEVAGQKFSGKGLDGYDPIRKKYIGMWVDSMSTSPVTSEGTYDSEGRVLTMIGEGPGPDRQPTKYKTTTEHKDKDTMLFTMYGTGPDGQEGAMFTITYKRRK